MENKIRKYIQFIKENSEQSELSKRINTSLELYNCFSDLTLEFPEYKYGYGCCFLQNRTNWSIEFEFNPDGEFEPYDDPNPKDPICYGFFIDFGNISNRKFKNIPKSDEIFEELWYGHETALDKGFRTINIGDTIESLRSRTHLYDHLRWSIEKCYTKINLYYTKNDKKI